MCIKSHSNPELSTVSGLEFPLTIRTEQLSQPNVRDRHYRLSPKNRRRSYWRQRRNVVIVIHERTTKSTRICHLYHWCLLTSQWVSMIPREIRVDLLETSGPQAGNFEAVSIWRCWLEYTCPAPSELQVRTRLMCCCIWTWMRTLPESSHNFLSDRRASSSRGVYWKAFDKCSIRSPWENVNEVRKL
jgi:hypothetical protein